MLTAERGDLRPCRAGFLTRPLSVNHFAELRTAHHHVLLRLIGYQRPTTFRPRHPLVRRGPHEYKMRERQNGYPYIAFLREGNHPDGQTRGDRPVGRVIFATLSSRENPGPGRRLKNRHKCLLPADDLVFVSNVNILTPPKDPRDQTVKGGLPGVLEAAGRFVARWHE